MPLTITAPDPTIFTTGEMLPGREDLPFSAIFSAENGTPPYVWSIAAGVLPPGLVQNADGSITGTPTNSGYWQFILQVTDSTAVIAQQTLELMIKLPYSALNVYSSIFYRVRNPDGSLVTDNNGNPISNDPNPNATDGQTFGSIIVGWSVGPDDFTVTDARTRGGGLAPDYQQIPQSVNCWDLGYWDGRPYPIGGALGVWLPVTLLNRMTRAEITGKLSQIVPTGTLPLLRFYDPATGEESR